MRNDLISDSAGVAPDAGRIKDHGAVVAFGLGRRDRSGWRSGGYRRLAGFDGCSTGSAATSGDRLGGLAALVLLLMAAGFGQDPLARVTTSDPLFQFTSMPITPSLRAREASTAARGFVQVAWPSTGAVQCGQMDSGAAGRLSGRILKARSPRNQPVAFKRTAWDQLLSENNAPCQNADPQTY
jgi:hypothetical protein